MSSLNMEQVRAARVVTVEREEMALPLQPGPPAETVARVEQAESPAMAAMAGMAEPYLPCTASPSVEQPFIQTRPAEEDMAVGADLEETAAMGDTDISVGVVPVTAEMPATPEPVERVEAAVMVAVVAVFSLPMVH
jgi:hypothetical protein